jgi:ankyrin repeat protein
MAVHAAVPSRAKFRHGSNWLQKFRKIVKMIFWVGGKSMIRVLVLLVVLLPAGPSVAGEPLFDAIMSGDRVAVERELANGADVNSRASDQATPLIAASLGGQVVIVELLLDKGAKVMARNSGGFTALHAAAHSGSVPIASLLLDRSAVLDDDENKAGVTPLMIAGEKNHLAMAEFLITEGADVRHAEIHGYLPITRALFKGNVEIVRLYKQHGAICQDDIAGWYERCMEIGK